MSLVQHITLQPHKTIGATTATNCHIDQPDLILSRKQIEKLQLSTNLKTSLEMYAHEVAGY